jgi:hypothetical protein
VDRSDSVTNNSRSVHEPKRTESNRTKYKAQNTKLKGEYDPFLFLFARYACWGLRNWAIAMAGIGERVL